MAADGHDSQAGGKLGRIAHKLTSKARLLSALVTGKLNLLVRQTVIEKMLPLDPLKLEAWDSTLDRVARHNGRRTEEIRDEIMSSLVDHWMACLGKERARREFLDRLARTLEEDQRFLLPGLQTRHTPPCNTWIYQNQVMQWDIAPGELVLDVGSGGYPFGKATHLVDLYTGETTHRSNQLDTGGRPLVVADLSNLPFKDKSWDFVFCSHVLEHLDQPGQGMRELMRVGRRGYIELPTRLSDVMLNFTKLQNHHRWHGLLMGDTLVFLEWLPQERKNMGSEYFFQCLQSSYHNEFQSFFERNWDVFFVRYHWRDRIKFLVVDKQGRVIDSSEPA